MTKIGGKGRVHFRVMQNLLTQLDSSPSSQVESSHFSSRVITRSIPSVCAYVPTMKNCRDCRGADPDKSRGLIRYFRDRCHTAGHLPLSAFILSSLAGCDRQLRERRRGERLLFYIVTHYDTFRHETWPAFNNHRTVYSICFSTILTINYFRSICIEHTICGYNSLVFTL